MRQNKRALVFSGGGARGAYQVGVWQFLQAHGWHPDLICGTSVGAINAAAIGSGMDVDELTDLWHTIERKKVYDFSFYRFFRYLSRRRIHPSILDPAPLREYIREKLSLAKLHGTGTEVQISAVNLSRGELVFFSNRQIGVEEIMASSAIPVVFPSVLIDGEPYWDGGTIANTPILPALRDRAVTEILIVLLSPVGERRIVRPVSFHRSLEIAFETLLYGSAASHLSGVKWIEREKGGGGVIEYDGRKIKLATVAPARFLGFRSILNFSPSQSDRLIEMGYRDSVRVLSPVLSSGRTRNSARTKKKVAKRRQKG